jgi:NADH-quinone oxidoreductase subunit N
LNHASPLGAILKNSLVLGGYTVVFDILFVLGGILSIFAAKQFLAKNNYELKEFYSLLVFSLLGMMFIAHANSLLILFLGIELMSISFFVLAGFFRDKLSSIEASLKYFLLGAFATGFLVFGIAMLYGATGSLELDQISKLVQSNQFNPVYFSIGLGLLFVGLAFKASTFPFHQWAPDVYTGAPTIVTAFMSTAGKTASFVALIIVAKSVLPIIAENANTIVISNEITKYSREILAVISAMTMLIGNITALVQKNVKRMLAFSSVAHAGYLLIGIVSNTFDGWSGMVFYSTAYILMQIGAFIVVSLIEKENETLLNIEDYNGLSKSNPYLAAAMAIFMFSLVGLPPFGGFFGKYYLFLSAIKSGYLWLTIVAVIASIISIYFYIGLVINMYFKDLKGESQKFHIGMANVSIIISLIGIILLGIFPGYLIDLALTFFK